ncbi:MAG: ThuA domain-containing protein [Planctomycetota bacterium]|nr:ThuA domain-containing protein [Planctomycetota bacterium]
MRILVLLAMFAPVVAASEPPPPPPRIPVLLITGENNHDFDFTSKIHVETLEKSARFKVTVTRDPKKTLATDDLRAYKVFVVDYNGTRWGADAEKQFAEWVQKGTGVVIIHAANNAFEGWKEYESMIALGWRKTAGHGRFHTFDVDVVDRNHPITAGLPAMKAHPDELYHGLTHLQGADYRVLLAAHSSRKSRGTGKVEPMALVTRFGKGRVFHTTLGHVWRNVPPTRRSITDPQFRLLLARGAEWAATGKVTTDPSVFGLPVVAEPAQRPISPWVYRCVLDKRARTVVVALDEHMMLAYDAANCSLYKAWGGRLELKGSVHDDSHGPQPEAGGLPYFEPTSHGWRILHADRTVEVVKPRWLGYRFENGRVVLQYAIARDGGKTIRVDESPEHETAGRPVLARHFVVKGLGEDESLELTNGGAFNLREGASRILHTFSLKEDPK